MSRDDDGFLARWSRRKQTAEAMVPQPPADGPAPADERKDEGGDEGKSDEQILAELGLPDPSTLQPGDDVRGFLQAAVPARLRRLALRQLWRSNPVLANLDELLDYGEDYSDAATVVENLQTAYRVGRGFWTDADERREREAAENADRVDKSSETTTDDPETAPDSPDEPAGTATAPDEPPEDSDHADTVAAATRRRMTFRYES